MARLTPPAIVVLGNGALNTARRIQRCYPDARVHGLRGRVRADAAVVMKLGRNFDKVRRILGELGLAGRALYVERATMTNQRIVPLAHVDPMASPYFSLLVVPGEKWQG